jgi:hypothetical protein
MNRPIEEPAKRERGKGLNVGVRGLPLTRPRPRLGVFGLGVAGAVVELILIDT